MSINKAFPRSGSWVPSFSNTVNLDSDPVVQAATWGLVGNLVTFQLCLTVDPTTSGATAFEFDLPHPPRLNFAGTGGLMGLSTTASTVGVATSVAASKRGILDWSSTAGVAQTMSFMGSYLLDN